MDAYLAFQSRINDFTAISLYKRVGGNSKVRCDAQFNCERALMVFASGGIFLSKTHNGFMDSVRFLSANRLVHNKLENPVHDSLTFLVG